MNRPFVKEALEFRWDNRNSTDIDRGMMSAEVRYIPQSTIYTIYNRAGDRAFTRHNYFKEIDMLLDAGHQQLLQDMILNRERINTGMN